MSEFSLANLSILLILTRSIEAKTNYQEPLFLSVIVQTVGSRAFSRNDFIVAMESNVEFLFGRVIDGAVSESVAIRENMFEFDHNLAVDSLIEKSGSPSYEVISKLVSLLFKRLNLGIFKGLGIEIGSGLGLLSTSLLEHDRKTEIKGIVALEGCRPYVEYGIRNVASGYIPQRYKDLMPYFDSFEDISVQDSTFDFAIQIESLHHADNPIKSLKEIYRTLNKGSFFLSIDRSWPDHVQNSVLESLLDHEYSVAWKKTKGLAIDEIVTRRDNGEHEYRDCEWIEFFTAAGFEIVNVMHLHPIVRPWEIWKTILCRIGMQNILGIKIKPRKGLLLSSLTHKLKLDYMNKYQTLVSPHPRPLTVILARKTD